MSPINIQLVKDSTNLELKELFGNITLREKQDTLIKINYPTYITGNKLKYKVEYGDLSRKIESNKFAYPFPKGKEYKIIQGNNGRFTHNTIYSKNAIDFSLAIGDTITSSDDGYIVGLIKDYKKYGTSKEWLKNDKSNYITIYHPHSGLYSQYVHLIYNGSLVKLGDYVKKGQPIGISGMTGFTTIPHLHFNIKKPTDIGLVSTEVEFESGIKGKSFKSGNLVK